jgi:SAM-dependent methyltransferase
MAIDARDAADFYATAQGAVTVRLLRQHLLRFWPDCARLALLGIGFAPPYLRLWREQAQRCIAVTPTQIGPARWPTHRSGLSCTADEERLPFPDLSFDRILLVHGLEQADNARRMLREAWRLLREDGRLIAIVPNRRSIWAYLEGTPFGHGQPYTPRQLGALFASTLFRIERHRPALFMPPLDWRLVLRSAPVWEAAGARFAPHLGGVTIVEVRKDVHALIPMERERRRRIVVETA